MAALEAGLRAAAAAAPGLLALWTSRPTDEDAIKSAMETAARLPQALPALEADLIALKDPE